MRNGVINTENIAKTKLESYQAQSLTNLANTTKGLSSEETLLRIATTLAFMATDSSTNDILSSSDNTLLSLESILANINSILLGSPSGGHLENTNLSSAVATQIDATSNFCKKAFITAPYTNTGYITVGFSTVTLTKGVILNPGESIEFPIVNTNLLYAISEVNGEDIVVTYFN
jgi:hypothetical protein